MSIKQKHVILTQDLSMSWHTTIRAGTLGVVITGDGGLTPRCYWVEFPNLPETFGRRQGAWVSDNDMRDAELLEIMGGGVTDCTPTLKQQATEKIWLKQQWAAARREIRVNKARERKKKRLMKKARECRSRSAPSKRRIK